MKAVVIKPDTRLVPEEVAFPQMKDGDIIIKVHAAGINRADLMQREGKYPPPEGWPEWPGLEVSGEVYAVSESVKDFSVGDRVCALVGGGGYAEYIALNAGNAMHLPDEAGFVEGAGIPEVYATAYLNLVHEAKIKKGDTVCVFAGASGVGIAVTQLAKAMGAKVISTVRNDEKAEYIKKFGADVIVNTKKENVVEVFEKNGVDVVIDCVGGADMGACFERMNRFGRWVVIAALGGKKTEINLETVYKKRLRIIGSTLRSRTDEEKAQILRELEAFMFPLLKAGKIRPEIYATFPLDSAEEAQQVVYDNKNIGKVILKVID